MKIHCLFDQMVKLSELKAHPQNRNKHTKAQLERLSKILQYQGFRYPIKVSKLSGFVTSGHGRIAAAKLNNWKEVPVVFQEYDSEDQEYADLTADNSIASWAELDLSWVNVDVGNIGPDFDIDLLGIKGFEIEPADKGTFMDGSSGLAGKEVQPPIVITVHVPASDAPQAAELLAELQTRGFNAGLKG